MDKQTFIQTYAPAAMEQQRKYGIPASVTLAQMALESAWGESSLAHEANNYFGIKASSQWINEGKPSKMYIDDHNYPEKFCAFPSVMDSMEYHSKILMGNRYGACRQYGQTDHYNWICGIKAGGYASDPNYVSSIESTIKANGLDRYDQQVASGQFQGIQRNDVLYLSQEESSTYCLPLGRTAMTVNSGYGSRKAPTAGASTFHKGLDIQAAVGENILATEDNGRVVAINESVQVASGKSVTVEYSRSDCSSYQTTYMHLNHISCQEGQQVKAGEVLGQTGNTGRSTGPHLHFSVNQITADGKTQSIDPSQYLAEISVRGQLGSHITKGNTDLLASYESRMQLRDDGSQSLVDLTKSNNPEDWLKMLSTADGSSAIFNSADPIAALVGSVLGGMMSMAQLAQMQDGKTPQKLESPSEVAAKDKANVIYRSTADRGKEVDLAKLSQVASSTFDLESPEQSEQQNNVKLA